MLHTRQIRFVEPLQEFTPPTNSRNKNTTTRYFQHTFGSSSTSTSTSTSNASSETSNNSTFVQSNLLLTPFIRHDVYVNSTATATANNNSSNTDLDSIYDVWEPFSGCVTLRYVERNSRNLVSSSSQIVDTNVTTTDTGCDDDNENNNEPNNKNNKNNSNNFAEATAAAAAAAVDTRDQLAADFSLFPSDVALIHHGSSSQQQGSGGGGSVRCDSFTSNIVVHDFHFVVNNNNCNNTNNSNSNASNNNNSSDNFVIIGRNSSIPDDDYFLPSSSSSSSNNSFLRLFAGSLCSTPEKVPVIPACSVSTFNNNDNSSNNNNISENIFAIECTIASNDTVQVPLSADKNSHRSCVAVVISGSVRIISGEVDPVGVLCTKGDAIVFGAVGDSVLLRTSSSSSNNNDGDSDGAIVFIVSAKNHPENDFSTTTTKNTNNNKIVSPHSTSHMFGLDESHLMEKMRQYSDGILAKTPATIIIVKPAEVRNRTRLRRMLLLLSQKQEKKEQQQKQQEEEEEEENKDPFEGKVKSVCIFEKKAKKQQQQENNKLIVGLSKDSSELLRFELTSTNKKTSSSHPSSYDKKALKNINLSNQQQNNLDNNNIDAITSVTLLNRTVVLGFSFETKQIVLVYLEDHNKEEEEVMVSWYKIESFFDELSNQIKQFQKEQNKSSISSSFSNVVEDDDEFEYEIVSATEISSTDISLFLKKRRRRYNNKKTTRSNSNVSNNSNPQQQEEFMSAIILIATFKSAELWKTIMSDDNSNNVNENTATTSSSFKTLTIQPQSLPTLEHDGSRLILTDACSVSASSSCSVGGDDIWSVQLQPMPGREYVTSNVTYLQHLAGQVAEVRHLPTFGCGVLVGKVSEFLPLLTQQAISKSSIINLANNFVEIPLIYSIQNIIHISDGEIFGVFYSVMKSDVIVSGSVDNTNNNDNNNNNDNSSNKKKKKQQNQQQKQELELEYKFGIAVIRSEKDMLMTNNITPPVTAHYHRHTTSGDISEVESEISETTSNKNVSSQIDDLQHLNENTRRVRDLVNDGWNKKKTNKH